MKNSGQFEKGFIPWNKGKKGLHLSPATQFKKGHGFVPVLERLMAKIQKTTSCWLWTASLNNQGYGRLGMKGQKRTKLAHRLMYEEVVGPTNGLDVLHTCDTPHCVNPDHLFLGTHKDNMQDMSKKDRWGNQTRKRL